MDEAASFYQSDAIIIMVLYNTSLELSDAFISLNAALNKVNPGLVLDMVVYDNSPKPVFNEQTKIRNWNVIYIHDPSNPGLSKASNEGFKIAITMKKKWILFTNPDTNFSEDYFLKLYTSVKNNPTIDLFAPILVSNGGIVSPAKFKFNRGTSLDNVTAGINDLTGRSILYSGMFISSVAFNNLGGFNNNIKLDFMDFYLIEKYKKKYDRFFLIDITCKHDLSSFEKNSSKLLRRFNYYCEGARNYSGSSLDYPSLFFLCFVRSVKFSLQFKNVSFIGVFLKKFVFARKLKDIDNISAHSVNKLKEINEI